MRVSRSPALSEAEGDPAYQDLQGQRLGDLINNPTTGVPSAATNLLWGGVPL